MSDSVIRVEGLGKKFRIGSHQPYHRFSELLTGLGSAALNAPRKLLSRKEQRSGGSGTDSNEFWALRDINFEVKQGDVIGIIGRNGAGKSTLLKILSRITEPSEGRFGIKGRVASLLEVGTGFHPELTGRENIFLSGSVLGMSRAEIKRKFDEIVDFAGVTQFLDTPVKRYSSGMQVRLGFAVAAHLEPEILIVDEVLAVGDAEFQKKCLGKMDDVAKSGRTILFVSHNMGAVSQLCRVAILLEDGLLKTCDPVEIVIRDYMYAKSTPQQTVDLSSIGQNGKAGITRVTYQTAGAPGYFSGSPITFELTYDFPVSVCTPQFCILVDDSSGNRVFSLISDYQKSSIPNTLVGQGIVACNISGMSLCPGDYSLSVKLWQPGEKLYEALNVLTLIVHPSLSTKIHPLYASTLGPMYVDADWECASNENHLTGERYTIGVN